MTGDEVLYIVDIIREVVEAVSTKLTPQLQAVQPTITGVHYLVGHHTEIRSRLQGLSKMQTGKFDRYPLIALFQDFTLRRGRSEGYFGYAPLQLMILYHTKKESYTEERYATVFKPILEPIKVEFENQLYKHKNVVYQYKAQREIDETERPHWGAPAKYGNEGYILDDVLDGIELFIPKVTFKQDDCSVNPLLRGRSGISATPIPYPFKKRLPFAYSQTIAASEHLLQSISGITVLTPSKAEIEVYTEIRENKTVYIESNASLLNHEIIIF